MMSKRSSHAAVYELCIFPMLAALMFCSDLLLDALPNVHLVGVLTMVYTVVYRARALIPLYLYVALSGVVAGFHVEWLPYVYVWALLWGATMLLPRTMPRGVRAAVYPLVCGLHGLAFGTLCAPMKAVLLGFSFEQTLAWITAGLPFDLVHMVGNLTLGLLILPLSQMLERLRRRYSPK